MKIIGKDKTEKGTVATIGSFDGVHQGHQFVVRQVIEQAHLHGLDSMVVTFTNHPLKVLRPDFKALMLTPADEKVEELKKTGVDSIALIDFTKELSMLTAREFMQKVLKEQLGVKVLIIGYDNHFGHDRKTFPDFVQYGKEFGIEVIQSRELPGDMKASSTIVRSALQSGDVKTANEVLGHSYYIKGKVVSGFHIGRKIGFPTANIEVNEDKLIPADGAYCVKVEAPQPPKGEAIRKEHPIRGMGGFYGMMNIGHRPTLDNGPMRSIEVNLFDCNEDLYGEELKIEFIHFLRPEQKFENIEELIGQLEKDRRECEEIIRSNG